MKKEIICGIYKITSPSGRIYIGESEDINRRWEEYNKLKCLSQRRLYSSFKKHSVKNHTFEILEECPFEELLCRERYWQDEFDVLSRKGLNCKLTQCGDKKQVHSKETIEKIRNSQKGNKYSLGYKHLQDTKDKISESKKGIKASEKTKELLSIVKKGNTNSKKCKVIDLDTLEIFESIRKASEFLNISEKSLTHQLRGTNIKKVNFIFLEEYNKTENEEK